MKNQQQAEREEQQRIKNLVLNYDLQQSEDQDGGTDPELQCYHSINIHMSLQAAKDRRRFTTTGWTRRTRTAGRGPGSSSSAMSTGRDPQKGVTLARRACRT